MKFFKFIGMCVLILSVSGLMALFIGGIIGCVLYFISGIYSLVGISICVVWFIIAIIFSFVVCFENTHLK